MPTAAPLRRIALAFALAAAGTALATDSPTAEGVSYEHGDWEVACDNTRTCRAAGYQPDEGDDAPVSVLFVRKAGAGTAVAGQVQLGEGWDGDLLAGFPARFPLTLRIDGRDAGRTTMDKRTLVADLAPAQVAALLQALRRDSRLEFVARDRTWTLSGAGASAVLLKMDEAQGRVGTVGALYRRGKQDESRVPPPLPAPVVTAVARVAAKPGDATLLAKHGDALRAALRATMEADDTCDGLSGEPDAPPLEIARLADTTLLVSTRCWLAAYNDGVGYWVVADQPPFRAELVTTEANGDEGAVLEGVQKGRGIGDCLGRDTWTWDGTRYVHTASATSGLCKGFAGGAWDLPTRVSDVRGAH